MNVVIRPQAYQDVVEVALYIGEDRPAAGERFLDAFESMTELLTRLPTLGSLGTVGGSSLEGLRVVAIRGFPSHLILYRPHKQQIEVVRVVHRARDLQTVVNEIE